MSGGLNQLGVSDAQAADAGIAFGSGTDATAETADIILINSDPKDIANLFYLTKQPAKK